MKLSVPFATLLLLPCAVVLIGWLAGLSGILLAAASGSGDDLLDILRGGITGMILLRTHLMAFAVAAAALVIGYPVAALMVRAPRWSGLLLALVLMPLLTSVVVRTFGWMILLGPRGVVNELLMATGLVSRPLQLMYNPLGVFIGLTHVLFPFAVLAIYPVRAGVEGAPLEAGASLGAGPVRRFIHVVLPLTAPGLLNAFAIVYLLAAGAIVTPLLLGGAGSETFGAMIYGNLFRFFDIPKAGVSAVALTLSCIAVVLPVQWLERRLVRHMAAAT